MSSEERDKRYVLKDESYDQVNQLALRMKSMIHLLRIYPDILAKENLVVYFAEEDPIIHLLVHVGPVLR